MDYVIYNKEKFIFLKDKPKANNNFNYAYSPTQSYRFDLENGVKTAKKLGNAWEVMTITEACSRVKEVSYDEAKMVNYDGEEYEVIEYRESQNLESYVENYYVLYGGYGTMIMAPDTDCKLPSTMVGSDIQFFE